MKIIRVDKKCAVCGYESNYPEMMSSFNRGGYLDLDLKPFEKDIGIGIQECPNCHYCNYDISKAIERRFINNPDLWKNDKSIQGFLSFDNEYLRRVAVVALQYKNNCDYYDEYKHLLMASWLSDDKEAEIAFQKEAMRVFFEEIFDQHIDDIMQAVDVCRQAGIKPVSESLVKMLDVLYSSELYSGDDLNEDDKLRKRVVEVEKELLSKNDTARHNMSEFVDKDKKD